MAFSGDQLPNWGCIVAAVIVVPLAFFVFLIASMGGGGCEGAPEPCEGDYTPMWIMMAGLAASGLLLSKAINVLMRWARRRRHP